MCEGTMAPAVILFFAVLACIGAWIDILTDGRGLYLYFKTRADLYVVFDQKEKHVSVVCIQSVPIDKRRRLMRSLLILALLTSSTFADKLTAKALFDEGRSAFDAKDFDAARDCFERAFVEYPNAALALNVALSRYMLDQPYAARVWLRRYYQLLPAGSQREPVSIELAQKIIRLIDEDYAAMGLQFGCSPRGRICMLSSHWRLVPGAIISP